MKNLQLIATQLNHSNHLSRCPYTKCPTKQQVRSSVCHVFSARAPKLWPGPGSRDRNSFHPKGRALAKRAARQRPSGIRFVGEAVSRMKIGLPAQPRGGVRRTAVVKEMGWCSKRVAWTRCRATFLNPLISQQGVTGQPGRIARDVTL